MRKLPVRRKAIHLMLAAILFTFVPGALFAQALVITTSEFIPFDQLAFVPCANGGAGELVLIEGTLHVLTHVTINGNEANIKEQFQPQGATGVGLTSGDTYQAVGGTKFHDTIPLTGGAQTFTLVNNFRLIGPGPGNNFQVHQNVHVTVNANGEVTTEIDNSSAECN